MATNRLTIKAGLWHPKSVKPIYRPNGDNRILFCCILLDGIKNVCYEEVRPDNTFIRCSETFHNEKYIRKHHLALEWEHIKVDYWAWVTDIIPI